jgi:hypothetical protein
VGRSWRDRARQRRKTEEEVQGSICRRRKEKDVKKENVRKEYSIEGSFRENVGLDRKGGISYTVLMLVDVE